MQQARVKWGLVLSLLVVLGCGQPGTVSTVKVTGTVTYNNQALSGVNVTFTPEKGPSAMGTTDSSGKFTLGTSKAGDGAVEGVHKVTITPGAGAAPPPMPGTPEAAKAEAPKAPFPEKYMDAKKSDLTAPVKKGEKNDFNFELKD